jgi:O-antigen ligase
MVRSKSNIENNKLSKILIAGFFVTLIISPTIKDPINSPKLWALLLLSSWLIPSLFENYRDWNINSEQKIFYFILITLLGSFLISGLFSENTYRALFGETQRRNGLLAYFALIAFAALATRLDISNKFNNFFVLMFIGTLTISAYGFLQNFGYDFVEWSNPYSPVIGTVGNPNFMGALLAILSMTLLPVIFIKSTKKIYKIGMVFFISFNFIVTFFTNALQGILIFVFGSILFLLFVLLQKFKKLGLIGLTFFFIIAIVAVLGIFQRGPLSSLLYKGSVTLRGYYWDAGIKMFLENPLFGVGIDSYGLYFNEVRELSYPLKFGYFVTSNNAHNLPIQLLATGGFFVGALYLIMVIFIFVVALTKLKNAMSHQKIILAGLTVSYLIFQLQSLVSIDNIGVSIWGWILAGLIIGFNTKAKTDANMNSKSISTKRSSNLISSSTSIFSWIFLIISFVLVALLYQGEKKTYDLEGYLAGTAGEVPIQALNYVQDTLDTPLIDPSYKLIIAEKLMERGLTDQAMQTINVLVNNEPRNLDYLTSRASFAVYLNNFELAIKDRREISKLNPYNAFNYKILAELYLKTGRINDAKSVLEIVNSFAPDSEMSSEIQSQIIKSEMGGDN